VGPGLTEEAFPSASAVILLDTHVLVWTRQGSARLGRRASRRIDGALRDGDLAVSAFSFWEIAMLSGAGRLRLSVSVEEFRKASLGAGVREVPVDGGIAILSAQLGGMHGDPADRIIVATALAQDAVLVTADENILRIKGGPKRVDATS
jgi:PIN domain nuclease of toxin-antitoxin system